MYSYNRIALKASIDNLSVVRLLLSIATVFVLIVLITSCKKINTRAVLEHDKVPPDEVSNVQIEPFPGGAKITYDIPVDLDFLYVQANYEIRPGVKEEGQSSFYRHYIEVEGFGDTKEHEVVLYTVDRSGNTSKGVRVTIKPETPPVQTAYSSLFYKDDFGGINVTFDNPSRSDLITTVMIKDFSGDWIEFDRNYTSVPDVDFSVRGLDAISTIFGVFIKDKWGNMSDTLIQELTPLKEEELNKNKFAIVKLPSDAETTTWDIDEFWDDDPTGGGFHTAENAGFPVWITIDLGITTRLSRLRVWQVHDGREYSGGNIQRFEIWGSASSSPSDEWGGWTLLSECEIIKPSGLPPGELSNDDVQQAAEGHEFSIPGSAPAVRYIRFKAVSSFSQPPGSSTGSAWLREITLWGQG